MFEVDNGGTDKRYCYHWYRWCRYGVSVGVVSAGYDGVGWCDVGGSVLDSGDVGGVIGDVGIYMYGGVVRDVVVTAIIGSVGCIGVGVAIRMLLWSVLVSVVAVGLVMVMVSLSCVGVSVMLVVLLLSCVCVCCWCCH